MSLHDGVIAAPGRIDGQQFRAIAARWLTGVTVVTTLDETGRPAGLTMNAILPLSLDPPQFLISLDLKSATLVAVRSHRKFCINFLAAGQDNIVGIFARKGGDKFSDVPFSWGASGLPVLDGTLGHVECEVASIGESGDHAVVIGNALHGHAASAQPLAYFASGFWRLAPCE